MKQVDDIGDVENDFAAQRLIGISGGPIDDEVQYFKEPVDPHDEEYFCANFEIVHLAVVVHLEVHLPRQLPGLPQLVDGGSKEPDIGNLHNK